MSMFLRIAILLLALSGSAYAAEVTCLCPIAMRALLAELGPKFEQSSGHKLKPEFVTLGVAADRVAKGDVADVAVVLPQRALDLEKQGHFLSGTRSELARSGYGIVVRKGAARPDIATVDALKSTLLKAASITYGDPAAGGPAGVYVAGLIERLGLTLQLKEKTKLTPNAETVIPLVETGQAEIGFTLASASGPSVEFAPLPQEVQNYTVYTAGVVSRGTASNAARTFIEFLSSPATKEAMRAKGFETR